MGHYFESPVTFMHKSDIGPLYKPHAVIVKKVKAGLGHGSVDNETRSIDVKTASQGKLVEVSFCICERHCQFTAIPAHDKLYHATIDPTTSTYDSLLLLLLLLLF